MCRLVPDHKTIADFRKDNGAAIRKVCAQFIALCRAMGLLTQANVAIDGSKFKAVNNRDKNFTRAKMERRMAQIEESVARYLEQLDTAKPRRGRPRTTGTTPMTGVRLPSDLERAIINWAKAQSDKPNKAEAIRRLVQQALFGKKSGGLTGEI